MSRIKQEAKIVFLIFAPCVVLLKFLLSEAGLKTKCGRKRFGPNKIAQEAAIVFLIDASWAFFGRFAAH
ncbi:hypothetical protein [Staphylococcus sp. 11262D007BW]